MQRFKGSKWFALAAAIRGSNRLDLAQHPARPQISLLPFWKALSRRAAAKFDGRDHLKAQDSSPRAAIACSQFGLIPVDEADWQVRIVWTTGWWHVARHGPPPSPRERSKTCGGPSRKPL